MTNYNERLDEIIRKIRGDDYGPMNYGSYAEAKQAITSLIKELVAEAKPQEHIDAYTYSNAKTIDDIRKIALGQFEQNLLKALDK